MTIQNEEHHKKKVVVVTGAGGQVGKLLFRQLLDDDDDEEDDEFSRGRLVVGIVHTQTSKDTLRENCSDLNLIDVDDPHECDDDESKSVGVVVVCDITKKESLQHGLLGICDWNNVDTLCICTSATAKPTFHGRSVFEFVTQPEMVDWIGQKHQIDIMSNAATEAAAAEAATSSSSNNCKHVVVCSTMGGTDPMNQLNNLGRTTDPTTGEDIGGNIVMWKRKSEMYLIEQCSKHNHKNNNDNSISKLYYTIIHPGGLMNEPGQQRELIVGINDDRMTYGGTGSPQTVPRADVAKVMAEACRGNINDSCYKNRSFDLRAYHNMDTTTSTTTTTTTIDYTTLLDPLEGKNCDYSLGRTM